MDKERVERLKVLKTEEEGEMAMKLSPSNEDPKKRRENTVNSAKNGCPSAQFILAGGLAIEKGKNGDHTESVELWRKSAEQGHAPSKNMLGFVYFNGIVVERDLEASSQWFLSSAKQDNIAALVWLSQAYKLGAGLPEDWDKADKCLLKAAELDDAPSQYRVAKQYEEKEQFDIALSWYRHSANNNYVPAMESLVGYLALQKETESIVEQMKFYNTILSLHKVRSKNPEGFMLEEYIKEESQEFQGWVNEWNFSKDPYVHEQLEYGLF